MTATLALIAMGCAALLVRITWWMVTGAFHDQVDGGAPRSGRCSTAAEAKGVDG